MNFNSIIGQKEITASLKNAIKNDRVGHAYVFTGPKGVGKKTVARIFASLLLCVEQNSDASCGECMPCQMRESGANPDLHIVSTTNATIGVEEIRKLQSDVIIRPLYSPRKVYLIQEADKMTAQAQNCLLKTLEEPPPYVVIILTAANYEALMETIRSRTIRFNFKKNTYGEVYGLLQTRFGSRLRGAEFIASYSDGVMGQALELAESEEFSTLREKTLDILLRLSKGKLLDVFDTYSFFESSKDHLDAVLDIMLFFYRDLLLVKRTGKENLLINSDKKDMILNNAPRFSLEKLVANVDIIETARKNIKQNANFQLAIEVMLMKLMG